MAVMLTAVHGENRAWSSRGSVGRRSADMLYLGLLITLHAFFMVSYVLLC